MAEGCTSGDAKLGLPLGVAIIEEDEEDEGMLNACTETADDAEE